MVVAAVQTLSVFCCIGVAFALLPSLYGGVLFAWHPLFMVVGYLGERLHWRGAGLHRRRAHRGRR